MEKWLTAKVQNMLLKSRSCVECRRVLVIVYNITWWQYSGSSSRRQTVLIYLTIYRFLQKIFKFLVYFKYRSDALSRKKQLAGFWTSQPSQCYLLYLFRFRFRPFLFFSLSNFVPPIQSCCATGLLFCELFCVWLMFCFVFFPLTVLQHAGCAGMVTAVWVEEHMEAFFYIFKLDCVYILFCCGENEKGAENDWYSFIPFNPFC